jgi:hypothetical protein
VKKSKHIAEMTVERNVTTNQMSYPSPDFRTKTQADMGTTEHNFDSSNGYARDFEEEAGLFKF